MPKSKRKIKCTHCSCEISASAFANHIKRKDHLQIFEMALRETEQNIKSYKDKKCICGNKICEPKNIFNLTLMQIFLNELLYERKFCSQKCSTAIPWNKGITKEEHPGMLRVSESKIGDKNPIHSILKDDKLRKDWIQKACKGRIEFNKSRRGKTLEDLVGKEKAIETKEKMSISAKNREIHGHTGKKHTEETKDKLRKITAKRISATKIFVSKPQKFLFESLKQKFTEEIIILEYFCKFYSFDIFFPNYNVAIEVDGDFWHSNSEMGFDCKYDSQKRNKINDKRKNTFAKNRGWTLLRFWASDVDNDIEKVIKEIENELRKNSVN
jgi:very-short-patch-repair endonuclease